MRLAAISAVFGVFIATAGTATAQLQDEPYGFSGGGPGISTAGKQAILAEEITGATPDNLVRRNGVLVDVTEGPDGVAVVRTRDGTFVPTGSVFDRTAIAGGARGRSGDLDIVESTTGFTINLGGAAGTGETVSSWTASVSASSTSAPPPLARTRDPIDQWTRQAHTLPPVD